MRPALNVRKLRPVQWAVGALMLAIPTSAVALTAGSADAQSAIQVTLNHQRLTYGQSLVATGLAPRAEGGRRLLLELAPAGRPWRTIGSATVHSNGRYRIIASPRKSGAVRVIPAVAATTARAGTAGGVAVPTASGAHQVAVAAVLNAPVGSAGALGGAPIDIPGTLRPRSAGRVVTLEGSSSRGWRTLARARTRSNGRFDLRYRAGRHGRQVVRVRFAGDRYNSAATTRASALTFFRQSLASWYNDGGATACGFHATNGVANKSLPCGTHVTFRYGGHTVTATVDDRGPFVGGREWDLNQNVAGALHFDGVGTVWSSR